MMRKILFLCLIFAGSLFADIKFVTKLEDGMAIAKKENKLVALTIVSTNCGWCHKLMSETLKNKKVEEIVNKNFVYVVLNKDIDQIPANLKDKLVPVTYFFDAKGNELTKRPVLGFWEAEDFVAYLNDALKKAKRNL
jgi:thioredoxin-related protein